MKNKTHYQQNIQLKWRTSWINKMRKTAEKRLHDYEKS